LLWKNRTLVIWMHLMTADNNMQLIAMQHGRSMYSSVIELRLNVPLNTKQVI